MITPEAATAEGPTDERNRMMANGETTNSETPTGTTETERRRIA